MSFTYPKNFIPFHTLYHHNIINESDRLWQEINPIVVKVGDINELYRELWEMNKRGYQTKSTNEYRDKLQNAIKKRTYEVEYMIEQFMHISFLYESNLECE
jgi:hypothetical protein